MPPNQKEMLDNIVQTGTNQLAQPSSRVHCVTIIGQIEGHMLLPQQNKTTKYEHIIPQLVAIEQDIHIQGFLLVMNTVGGDVEAGLALAEMVAGMSKPSVSLVLGGGHSIGVPLAVSTNYSFIAPTATMTIHPIRLNGMIIPIPQTYEYINKMQERIVSFLVEHSHVQRKMLMDMMVHTGDMANDVGTVLVGQQAVQCGLIHQVGGIAVALEKLNALIGEGKNHDHP